MKRFSLLPLLLLTGCCCYWHAAPKTSGQFIVNNSGYKLDIFQDGAPIARNVAVGKVLLLRSWFFQRTTSIIITGHTVTGAYVGSNTYIFQDGATETWSVNRLYLPKSPQ
jgi:hypothetical protein